MKKHYLGIWLVFSLSPIDLDKALFLYRGFLGLRKTVLKENRVIGGVF